MASSSDSDRVQPTKRTRGRRGGKQQRNAEHETVILQSVVCAYLIEQWAWGGYSPQEAQRVGKLVMQDIETIKRAGPGARFRDLEGLAHIGDDGKYPGNMHRDMLSIMPNINLPQPAKLDLPMQDSSTGQISRTEQAILYPHLMFASLYHHFRAAFFDRLVPDVKGLESFWNNVSSTEQYKDHPLRHKPNHKRRCIPLFLHGDAVPCTGVGKSWSKLLDIWSWGSLMTLDGKTMLTNFLIFSFYTMLQTHAADEKTYETFWIALCWSLECLYIGKHPYSHWDGVAYGKGTPEGKLAGTWLADGWFGALWCIIGDLDYFHAQLNLRHHGSSAPCSFCPADSTTMPWSEFRPGRATWMRGVYTATAFKTKYPDCHRIFSLPGVSINTVWPDYMHCKYMGVDQYFLGSVLVLMTFTLAMDGCMLMISCY